MTQPISPAPDPAAVAPRAAPTSTPTPRQAEFDAFVTAIATNGGPPRNYAFAPDGSAIDPNAADPTQPSPTWP